jgi:hypothetical protein
MSLTLGGSETISTAYGMTHVLTSGMCRPAAGQFEIPNEQPVLLNK